MLLVPSNSTPLLNFAGMDNKEIRRENLIALARELGGLQALADKTGTDAKYLSQVNSRWQGRGMGDKVARKIEDELGKPLGWMDQRHQTNAGPIGAQELLEILDDYMNAPAEWQSALRKLIKLPADQRAAIMEAVNQVLSPGESPMIYNSRHGNKAEKRDIKKRR